MAGEPTIATGSEKPEQQNKNPSQRKRARLIVRLGALLISHSVVVSVLCCAAGIVALFLLPVLAKNTYISENALMPGSANPTLSGQDLREAEKLIKSIVDSQESSNGRDIPSLIAQHMTDLGAEAYYHKFYNERREFHPFHFFSSLTHTRLVSDVSNYTTVGVNCVGIIRAPRGDGKESIVMVTPYNSQKVELSDILSIGLGYSVFHLLSQVTWLAKDIVWVAADSQFGEHSSVDAWIREYHNPNFFNDAWQIDGDSCSGKKTFNDCKEDHIMGKVSGVFRRAGTIAAGLIVKVVEKEGYETDTVTIYSEASNGQMPNLDLINIVHYLAVHRQAFHVKVGTVASLLKSARLKFVGKMLEWLSKTAGHLYSKWSIAIAAADYVEGASTLASSMYSQAVGIPTGPHGAFRDYQIDAITLEISPRMFMHKDIGKSTMLLRSGRLIEGVIRSVNNLLEKFHQSFFLYLMTSPNKFVSVGVYMVPFALLVAPLPIVAAALFSKAQNLEDGNDKPNVKDGLDMTKESDNAFKSWQWIRAARVVFLVHFWAIIVSLLPYFISQISNTTPTSRMLIWLSMSLAILAFFYTMFDAYSSCSRHNEWQLLKAVAIIAATVGLGLMSIINFATAQIGAVFLVPMCLLVQPLRRRRQLLLALCNLILGVVGFPPAAVLLLEGFSKGFAVARIGNFWECAASLWIWNSATYLYIALIHLPCWVLCMHILLL